jgi:hypothetical protein
MANGHSVIDHADTYVDGAVHTTGLPGFGGSITSDLFTVTIVFIAFRNRSNACGHSCQPARELAEPSKRPKRCQEVDTMRTIVLTALTLGLVVVQTDLGLTQPTGTPSELADDALTGALWRIAIATQTRIGFESIEFVRSGMLKSVPPIPVSSRDEALRTALVANPRYEWRAVGDFVVVRPKGAWNNTGDPFNRPVRNLRVDNGTETGVLLGLRDFIYTNRFAVHQSQSLPVTIDVQSGTVIDVLNQLLQSSERLVLWNATYRPNAQPEQRFPRWDLNLALRDSNGMQGTSASQPPKLSR